MLHPGDVVITPDLGLLQGENGVFEAEAPGGEVFIVLCQPGHSIVSIRPKEMVRGATAPDKKAAYTFPEGSWFIQKMAEIPNSAP